MAQIIVETLRIIVTTMGNSDVLCKKQQDFSSGMIMISHNSRGMIMISHNSSGIIMISHNSSGMIMISHKGSDVSSPSLGPPARPSEGIFARLEPARSSKT